jgi:beta-barrel assembly-enhancing protease
MKHFSRIPSILLAAAFATASLSAEEPKASRAFYNSFSDEEEMKMGSSSAEDVETTRPILTDRELTEYLESVGQKVAAASQRPQLRYHFLIVNSPSINAFSLPGGYVYVNRGLLEIVESEAELAGVLGHEVGHVVAFHSMNDVARRWWADRAINEVKKAGLTQDQKIQSMLDEYGGTFLLFVNKKFSREEENEADLLGLYNAARGGWDANGLIVFLTRLIEAGGSQDLYAVLRRNHPLAQDRVDDLKAELKTMPPAKTAKKNSTAFRAMKDRLRTFPPPPPLKSE